MVKHFPLILLSVLLISVVSPLVEACFNPSDGYAVEVLLNKPGVSYDRDLNLLREITVDNRTFLLRVWEGSRGLHVRIEIPYVRHLGAYWEYTGFLVITSEDVKKLADNGWLVNGSSFRLGNVTITVNSIGSGTECREDGDCATAGCSGELCLPREEAGKIVTPCVYRKWYECFSLTSCGCVNGLCSWKPNPDFERCLREHGVDPSNLIRAGTVKVYGKGPDPEELERAVKEFLTVLGVNCTKIEVHSGSAGGPAYDPSTLNASKVVREALETLVEEGNVRGLENEDIGAIARVSSWGKAGWNSHIGWYETKNGTYAWIPYDESRDPLLVGYAGCGDWDRGSPTGSLRDTGNESTVSPTGSPEKTESICGPSSIVLVTSLVSVISRVGQKRKSETNHR